MPTFLTLENNNNLTFSKECYQYSKNYKHYSLVEMELLLSYWNTLLNNGVDKKELPFELFEQQYLCNILYFTIFCIRQKYSCITKEQIEKFREGNIDGLHLRSIPHIEQLLERCHTLVDKLDIEILKKYTN